MQAVRKNVAGFVQKHGLFSPGDRVVVAVSGGADSMALLDILANLPGFGLRLVVAHLNHLLRGEESDADEVFVRNVSVHYGFPCEVARVDILQSARQKKLCLEDAGREARRHFLKSVAEKHGATVVALGHHREDQAETVLMRLMRGAAGSGLAGMRPRSVCGFFVRPLLCMNRATLETYLVTESILFREDSSNSDLRFLRNRVRHELLPFLQRYNTRIVAGLNRTAEALAADEELLESVVTDVWRSVCVIAHGRVTMSVCGLQAQPQALRKRVYRKSIMALRGSLRRISSKHLAGIDDLVTCASSGGRLSLPSGIVVNREHSVLVLSEGMEVPETLGETTINECGMFVLTSKLKLSVEVYSGDLRDFRSIIDDVLFVDSATLPFPWTVRGFKQGDRFTPFGMTGRKKLKKLFIDRKIPAAARSVIPVLTCNGDIFWVAGVQAAEITRISGQGGKLLCLSISSVP